MKGKQSILEKLPGLERLPKLLERFKYPLGILLLGAALLLWPGRKTSKPVEAEPVVTAAAEEDLMYGDYCRSMERQLEGILNQIDGAGRVRVLLTLKRGPAASYQTDVLSDERSEGEETRLSREEKTVILNRGSAYDELAVVSTACPVFQGALIVAEGGADPEVRYRLSAAVAALLDLGADQITVVKMK